MLDERKVKLMTQLALYDQTQGKEDFKISEYYRKDYAGVHILYTVLAAVVGYVVVLVSYIGIASHLYNKKHQEARQRVKRYNHILTRLLKMYEKETK